MTSTDASLTPDASMRLHFLLAVDDSPASLNAARWLAAFAAGQTRWQCTALAVQAPLRSGEVSAIAPASVTLAARERDAQVLLEQVKQIFQEHGSICHTLSCMGEAAPALLQQASALQAQAIVMGRRNQGALRAALLGSVSQEVVRQASMPVIVVGEGVPAPVVDAQTLRLLLALDASPAAQRAADFAAHLIQSESAQANLLHAAHVSPSVTLVEALLQPKAQLLEHWAGAPATQSLAAARALLVQRGVQLREHALSSDVPGQAIAALAAELQSDLLVMGTRGLGPVSTALLGSVTQSVLRASKVAVALVR